MSGRIPYGPARLECPVCKTDIYLSLIPGVLDDVYECKKCGSRAYEDEGFIEAELFNWMITKEPHAGR